MVTVSYAVVMMSLVTVYRVKVCVKVLCWMIRRVRYSSIVGMTVIRPKAAVVVNNMLTVSVNGYLTWLCGRLTSTISVYIRKVPTKVLAPGLPVLRCRLELTVIYSVVVVMLVYGVCSGFVNR